MEICVRQQPSGPYKLNTNAKAVTGFKTIRNVTTDN